MSTENQVCLLLSLGFSSLFSSFFLLHHSPHKTGSSSESARERARHSPILSVRGGLGEKWKIEKVFCYIQAAVLARIITKKPVVEMSDLNFTNIYQSDSGSGPPEVFEQTSYSFFFLYNFHLNSNFQQKKKSSLQLEEYFLLMFLVHLSSTN